MYDCAIREFDHFIRVLMEHDCKCINIVIKFGGLMNYLFIFPCGHAYASCIVCIFPDIMHDHMHWLSSTI